VNLWRKAFLADLYSSTESSSESAALVYRITDALVAREGREGLDAVLPEIESSKLDVTKILALLTACIPFRAYMRHHEGFYRTAESWIKLKCPDNWESQLQGLGPAPAEAVERIVAAACRRDGLVFFVEQPKRHDSVIAAGCKLGLETPARGAEQGFVTSRGRFVGRKVAAKIAWVSKQTKRRLKGLTSEDVW